MSHRLTAVTRPSTTITSLARGYAQLHNLYEHPTAAARRAYDEAGAFYRTHAERLIRYYDLDVTITSRPDPYPTAEAQFHDLIHGRITITSAYSRHNCWDPFTNVAYRIVHDVVGHRPTPGSPTVPDFTVAGELVAWRQQLDELVLHQVGIDIINVSFTETIGQLAYAAVYHDFPEEQRGFIMYNEPFRAIIDDRTTEEA